jgi:uncharacterized protein YjbJ (UPF0337 family)
MAELKRIDEHVSTAELIPAKTPKNPRRRTQMNTSTKDEIKGTLHEVKGKVKETAGKVTNNPNLQAEGNAEKNTGKVEKKVGQIEKVFEK